MKWELSFHNETIMNNYEWKDELENKLRYLYTRSSPAGPRKIFFLGPV